jgi:hypothetical protein
MTENCQHEQIAAPVLQMGPLRCSFGCCTPADDDEESFKRIEIRASCKLQRGIHVLVLQYISEMGHSVKRLQKSLNFQRFDLIQKSS